MSEFFKKPDLRANFPGSVSDMKINMDLGNRAHGPHFDLLQAIEGGTEQVRIGIDGEVLGGTTNFGKKKIDW